MRPHEARQAKAPDTSLTLALRPTFVPGGPRHWLRTFAICDLNRRIRSLFVTLESWFVRSRFLFGDSACSICCRRLEATRVTTRGNGITRRFQRVHSYRCRSVSLHKAPVGGGGGVLRNVAGTAAKSQQRSKDNCILSSSLRSRWRSRQPRNSRARLAGQRGR